MQAFPGLDVTLNLTANVDTMYVLITAAFKACFCFPAGLPESGGAAVSNLRFQASCNDSSAALHQPDSN